MKFIAKEEINKIITKTYSYEFSLEEDILCLIEIIASAKSWWQNFKSSRVFSKDDDIFLFLDNQELTTSRSKKPDARSSWNGNELKELEKTVLIAVNLKPGNHTITLRPNQTPYLKTIAVSKVEEGDKIIYIPTDNNPAQKGEGRPWLSYIILDLFITNLTITARANKNRGDDDDIKLVINEEIQKNENKRAHKYWYWCGKILKGKDKTFSKDVNSQAKQYNFDLYSDEAPRLSKIEIGIKPVNTKRIPTVDDPLWTGDFRDDTEEMLLARAIFGETNGEPHEAKIWVAWSVRNRVAAKAWPDTVAGVILQKGQYDPFKPDNDTFKKIISPLDYKNEGEADRNEWFKCYEIAQKVLTGEIESPTTATHFIGRGANVTRFERITIPKGEFIKQIGGTRFYWSPN